MHLLFIDESGTIPPPDKVKNSANCFALGGIIIPENIWYEISLDLKRIKNNYSITGEIKWRYFVRLKPDQKPNPLSHLNFEQKEKLRSEIYLTICKYKSIRLISAIIDIKKSYSLEYISNTQDLYWFAYKQMTERFQYYLQDLSRTVGDKINGIIICDHRQPKEDIQLRQLHQNLVWENKRNFSNYPNLVEGVFIAPSHLSVGIQFADMIGGAVFRKFSANDSRFFNQIETSFRKSPKGSIEGYGLIKWPTER